MTSVQFSEKTLLVSYSLVRRSDQSYFHIEITVYYYSNPKSNLIEIRVTLDNFFAILRDF
ncbi:MAG: hypothetical protein F6K63_11060 [Moorea sp. SIO1G6]|uniref:hypothetical protein n=1 Tax=Moorena sp. SIO1G6 TaxID=2607840 RepID=UPI0013C26F96|nr:hypothetical protein [Moorena sp. SIO1G6]NET64893.1 hypothetical protein [Moorena sp. SIO1G6]